MFGFPPTPPSKRKVFGGGEFLQLFSKIFFELFAYISKKEFENYLTHSICLTKQLLGVTTIFIVYGLGVFEWLLVV